MLQGGAHSLLERGVVKRRRELGRTSRLVGAKSKLTQSHHDIPCLLPGSRLPCRTPRLIALFSHEVGSERALRFVLIVSPAAKPHASTDARPPRATGST